MTSSIRTFLLVNLLLSVTLVTSLAIIGNLFLEHKEFQTHLDSQLTLAAYTIEAFLDEESNQADLKRIQGKIKKLPELINQQNYQYRGEITDLHTLFKSVQFQVWNRQNQLILHSYAAPPVSLDMENNGFDNVWRNGKPWRVFSTYKADSGMRIVVLQRYDFRVELERKITHDSILIMLITYPFLGLLIWIIVGRGLDSVNRTARELRDSDPRRLHPLSKTNVPLEIQPLVDELNRLFKRLKDAFSREQRFAGDAAHELRTPLAAISAQAQVAKQATTDQERKAALSKVLKGVDRSTHVVKQLLTLSRMVPEALQEQMELLGLRELTSEMIAELAPQGMEKNINLSLNAADDLSPIRGNKIALSILLRNLIDNALRYSPEQSAVIVNLFQDMDHQILQIIDNGPGIPDELKQRVFERFYRVIGNKQTGSGLGFSIIKQITDLHEADISLLDAPDDHGLCVQIRFPIK